MNTYVRNLLLAPALGLLLVSVVQAGADGYDVYREYIDNYQAHTSAERDRAIQELIGKPSNNVERDYLLGILNYLQAREAMRIYAKENSKTKPTIAEAARNPVASRYIWQAKHYYDEVEQRSPGYKYIYCKFGELYRDTYDIEGLRVTVRTVGRADPGERVTECKRMLEESAIHYSQYGSMGEAVVQAIFEEMTLSWLDYPKYILEPLGDIAQFQNNVATNKKSYYWWDRCAHEVQEEEIKHRCLDKLAMLKPKGAAKKAGH